MAAPSPSSSPTFEAAAGPSIGFVGLGTMGRPMCLRLLDAGHRVTVHDIDATAVAAVVDRGAVAAPSARLCAETADVLFTSLPMPQHVEAVMAGADGSGAGAGALGALRPGSIWVDLSTNSPELLRRLAATAPPGVSLVDSPVTGAVDGARHGTLTLFTGGEAAAIGRVRPLLSRLGRVIECGPLGTGTVVKLVTNQLWFAAAAALGEGFAVGLANGVDLRTLWEAVLAGVADSFVARHDAPEHLRRPLGPVVPAGSVPEGPRPAGRSGIERRRRPAHDRRRPGPAFERAAARYGGRAGEMSVARRIAEDAGLSMRLDGNWVPHWQA